MAAVIHLRGRGVDVLIDESPGVPVIVHWGAPLGGIDEASVLAALARQTVPGGLAVVAPISVVPEHGSGFPGRPGLSGHRPGGKAWAPRFQPAGVEHAASGITVHAVDAVAALRLTTTITVDDVLSIDCTLSNEGSNRYLLGGLHPTMPLPAHASDLLTFVGRWSREFQPVRRDWASGAWVQENRSGRTSHEHAPLLFAGEPVFGEWLGEVWGVHVAWSGNHTMYAECLPDGRRYVQGGELLHPGECCLQPGETYSAPTLVGVYSASGLTPAGWGFHRLVRSFAAHPDSPRPVLLNTWEAVYFNHDIARLKELATAAAAAGVERFVLDDGWFGSRRDSTSGLGDWWVAPDVYSEGLAPLITHVRDLGMDFGIWVEPEMMNPDSDTFRAHPEWALVTDGYEPMYGRHQLVIDLARADAFEHVLAALDRLLRDHDIAYLKWDMNRVHVQASGVDGAAGTSAQTRAVYRLLDALRARHPRIEIESCAGGGGRIDVEILRRVQRVWTSDCNDALERQTIQRGTSLLLPWEVMGAHIGPTRSHTTGRMHSLAFRGLTAMFGHLGVEWNVLTLSDEEREQLAEMIALHKRFRPLLHSGDSVRFDPVVSGHAAASHAYGVYSTDRRQALVAHVQLSTGMSLLPPPLRLPGLMPDARYTVDHIALPGSRIEWAASGLVLTGAQLAAHGVQLPRQHPESGMLLHLTAL
ncbi:MAG: alpha-galactosidase [Actinobacteria bacterium]|nr:alpha-galactosidase [Actinomycetota bacterium]